MFYEEALGVGRHLTAIQRNMLFDLSNWTAQHATAYNRDELIWKKLIELSAGGHYVRTERGEHVVIVARLKASSDGELILAWHTCDMESELANHLARELEDRRLDF